MNKKGFTLIELLVVMFIIAVLSTIVLINYRKGEKKYAFNHAVQRFVSDLHRAQNESISGAGISDSTYCGYGVSVEDNDKYILYGDDATSCNHKYSSGNDGELEIVKFVENAGFRFQSTDFDVFFEPPKPTTWGSGSVVLEMIDGSLDPRTITVTSSGLIEVQ